MKHKENIISDSQLTKFEAKGFDKELLKSILNNESREEENDYYSKSKSQKHEDLSESEILKTKKS